MRYLLILLICFNTHNILFGQKQEQHIIHQITFKGNEKTLENVLLREMTFQPGDTIQNLSEQISQSQTNLLNTRLFHHAKFHLIKHKKLVNVIVNVQERWYLWPIPIFEYADHNLATWVRRQEFDYLNYGLILEERNFRGRNEKIKFKIRRGIREQYGINYLFPRILNQPDVGGYLDISFFRQKEIHQSIVDQEYVDLESQKYIYHEGRSVLGIRWRPGLYYNHLFYGAYRQYRYDQAINSLFNEPVSQQFEYVSIGYTFNFFKGDYIAYPLRGNKLKLNTEYGLGEKDYFLTDISFSSHHPVANRFTLSYGFNGYASFTKQYPYFLFSGPGKTWYIRGFEDNAYQQDLLLNNRLQMKYTLLNHKTFHFNWIPTKKFNSPFLSIYINLFAEGGYGTNLIRDYSEISPMSFGAGIDFLTYYDWIGRLEVTVNNDEETFFNVHWGYIF